MSREDEIRELVALRIAPTWEDIAYLLDENQRLREQNEQAKYLADAILYEIDGYDYWKDQAKTFLKAGEA